MSSSPLGILFSCIFSPRLLRVYNRAAALEADLGQNVYMGNWAERCGDFAITYAFPAGVMWTVWQRRWNYILYLSAFLVSSYALRAAGRAFNPTYVAFLRQLKKAVEQPNGENLEAIRKFDFEFKGWPVTFEATAMSSIGRAAVIGEQREMGMGVANRIEYWLSWLVAHSFGIRLIYPGLLMGPMIRHYLEEYREKLVVLHGGIRAKVKTVDGNSIDTLFIDKRRELNITAGKTLVICCEGNAGFYEIGQISTPMQEGYSCLGWNHPGFGGSTGTPYPLYELNAAEAVFEYAVKELGFAEEEIILYGWSIGGYPSAYLASQYPNVKGLVLDATFDDVMPLALPRMPAFMSPIVRATIRYHVNLRVSNEVENYRGPIRLIRRTEDEIIAEPALSISGNRGNFLLKDILRTRYPQLLDNDTSMRALDSWINSPHVKDTAARNELARSAVNIPENLGALSDLQKSSLIIQIAERILTDFKSSHCQPLPGDYFILPWSGGRYRQKQL